MALPFSFNLYGTAHQSCYINNNGNISFGSPYSTFVSTGFPIAQYPMIAAFWADVDTDNPASGLVYYKITDHAMIVRYHQVGYFPMGSDYLNDFQVIISDGQSNLVPNGNNIGFCYGDMQWTNGGNALGGAPANLGANAGDGVSAMQIGLFNHTGDDFDGPYNNNDGVDYLDYSHIYFSTNPVDSNQMPVNVSNYCDTIWGGAGDTLAFFYFDDISQQLVYNVIDSSGIFNWTDSIGGLVIYHGDGHALGGITERSGSNGLAVLIPANVPAGDYPIWVMVTDNGSPALTNMHRYVIHIEAAAHVSTLAKDQNVVAYINNGYLNFKGVDANKVQQLCV
jgi:hypothetical protein